MRQVSLQRVPVRAAMAVNLLSVVIITLNEESRLEKCLESVSFADEIVVVDSGSQDRTVSIALSFRARVIQQKWLGFGPQKQFGVEQASYDWVLCIDADEQVSPELAASIRKAMEAPSANAWQMPRRNRFMGRWLKHGEGYPDLSLRLFHREHARWSDDQVHETVEADCPVGQLNGDLLHESEETLADYLTKQNRYTSLQAQSLFERGRIPGASRLVLSPVLRFIKFYLIRQGFRDGLPGFVHICIGCMNSFMKYAKTIEKQIDKSDLL